MPSSVLTSKDDEFHRLGFPPEGTKLKFKGAKWLWFTDYVKRANKNLKVGDLYTLKSIEVYSSWAKVTLEEVKGDYALMFFEYEKN